jgi:hypothetical protein
VGSPRRLRPRVCTGAEHLRAARQHAAPQVRGILEQALLLFLWVGPGALRRVRGRPSQVKGACGVADASALRAPLDLRAPRAELAGRPGACPIRVRSAPGPRCSGGRR